MLSRCGISPGEQVSVLVASAGVGETPSTDRRVLYMMLRRESDDDGVLCLKAVLWETDHGLDVKDGTGERKID